jgi:hypothetical protein
VYSRARRKRFREGADGRDQPWRTGSRAALDKVSRRTRESANVITGFNTDVKYRGVVYHVQTEDKGTSNPLIETLIYKGGEILASRRLPYADLVKGPQDEATITKLMEEQHKGMIMEVKRGKFDPAGERTVMEDLSLDEIVLAYLAARAASR